jgi:hypothetical protein
MTPSDDEALREEVADICRTGHHSIAETKVVNSLMALISQKIKEARIDENEHMKQNPAPYTFLDTLGVEQQANMRIYQLEAALTTKQDTKS